MVIENKINEEGYTVITRFYVLGGKIVGDCEYGDRYNISVDRTHIYINAKPTSNKQHLKQLHIKDRSDILTLNIALRQSRKGDKYNNTPTGRVACATKNGFKDIIAIFAISSFEAFGVYAVIDNEVFKLDIVLGVGDNVLIISAYDKVGVIVGDEVEFNTIEGVNVSLNYEYTLSDIAHEHIRIVRNRNGY